MSPNNHSEATTEDHGPRVGECRDYAERGATKPSLTAERRGRLRSAVNAGHPPWSPFGPDPVMPDPSAA